MGVGDDVRDIEALPADLVRVRFQHQPHGLPGVTAVHFGSGANLDRASGQVVSKQVVPLVRSEITIDAGEAQARGGEVRRIQGRERLFPRSLMSP